jgi:ligand-binding SRPBCC domain-containing protein
MPVISLETNIKSSPDTIFDLSRSVDLHKASMAHHGEEVIDGTKNGLMEKGDFVTWKAKHLFWNRTLKVQITDIDAPEFFSDEMVEGDFKKMRHEHHFKSLHEGTLMIDKFYFERAVGSYIF